MSTERFEEKLQSELAAIETVLRGLTPATETIQRDRLMYLAGRASAQRASSISRFAWPLTTAALLLLSLTLGARSMLSSGPVERIIYVDRPAHGEQSMARLDSTMSPAASPARFQAPQGDQLNYMQLRNVVLTRGADSMPAPSASGASHQREPVPVWPALHRELIGG